MGYSSSISGSADSTDVNGAVNFGVCHSTIPYSENEGASMGRGSERSHLHVRTSRSCSEGAEAALGICLLSRCELGCVEASAFKSWREYAIGNDELFNT